MAEKTDPSTLSDLVLGHLSPEESLRVIESLESNPAASAQVEMNIRLMTVSAMHGDAIFQEVPRGTGSPGHVMEKLRGWVTDVIRVPQIAIPTAVVMFLFLFGAGVYGARMYLTPRYAALAIVDSIEFRVGVRAAGQEEIEMAYRFYQAGDHRSSLRLLERHLRAYPSGPLTDYVRYSAGAVYLESAQGWVLGIVPRFDSTLVRKGMTHLQDVASKSPNPRLVEESRWLLGKGYLMLGSSADALTELDGVAELRGPRREEAVRLMSLVRDADKEGAR